MLSPGLQWVGTWGIIALPCETKVVIRPRMRRDRDANASRATARQTHRRNGGSQILERRWKQVCVTKPLFAAAAPDQRWYRIETSGRATVDQLWDAAYEMHTQSAGSVVEPDSETLWTMPTT